MKKVAILIVEDEGIIALQIKNSLEQKGYTVVAIFASGEEALATITVSKPDLVLMDMKLQGQLGGIETADRLRKQYHLPVIYLTAHSEENTIELAKITEPYGYILKPFNQQELYIAVEMALYKHAVTEEKARLMQELQVALDKYRLSEEALRKAKEEAEAANRLKSKFLAVMSHEIRTSINGVIGFLSLLAQTRLDDDQDELIHDAQTASATLLYVINDILDLSKIEAGKLDMQHLAFAIRQVVQDALVVCTPKAREKGLKIQTQLAADIPNWVGGDPIRLRQILHNLIGNAVKFTQRGEVTVTVNVQSQSAQEVCLRFTVRDTGIGISPKDQQRLFQSFSQVGFTSIREQGSGLGLAIAKSLVEMMRGTIGLESEVGKGSCFYFTACFSSVALEAAPLAPTSPGLAPDQSREYPGSSLRILLADDSENNRLLVTKLLNKLGVQCDIAGDGQEAVLSCRQQQYDIVFMDCLMPVLDGYQATAQIRAMENGGQRPVIIAMTGNSMEGDRQRCLAAGMDDYLAKPISGEDLWQCLKKYGL